MYHRRHLRHCTIQRKCRFFLSRPRLTTPRQANATTTTRATTPPRHLPLRHQGCQADCSGGRQRVFWIRPLLSPASGLLHRESFLVCTLLFPRHEGGQVLQRLVQRALVWADIIAHWPAVKQADMDGVASFIQHQIFELVLRSQATNMVDGFSVKIWKNRSKGLVKSRCCGRGSLDKQQTVVDKHSSTAFRSATACPLPRPRNSSWSWRASTSRQRTFRASIFWGRSASLRARI